LDSCEDFIHEYRVGFTYDSLDDLVKKLRSREALARLRENAEQVGKALMFENNLESLRQLMSKVCCKAIS